MPLSFKLYGFNERSKELPDSWVLVLAQLDAFRVIDAGDDVPKEEMCKVDATFGLQKKEVLKQFVVAT